MIRPLLRKIITPVASIFFQNRWKEYNELRYWKKREKEEGELSNDHYIHYFTKIYSIDKAFYTDKKVLDIGCGPRGSLEWADNATERVGLDPLANDYLKLGAKNHAMKYVASGSENIPFSNGYFDVVTSFNSIDHVEDLDKTISEIKRVLKKGGTFLLVTDVNHKATACEPQEFSWDVTEKFKPEFELIVMEKLEKSSGGVFDSVIAKMPYNDNATEERYGVLLARFKAV